MGGANVSFQMMPPPTSGAPDRRRRRRRRRGPGPVPPPPPTSPRAWRRRPPGDWRPCPCGRSRTRARGPHRAPQTQVARVPQGSRRGEIRRRSRDGDGDGGCVRRDVSTRSVAPSTPVRRPLHSVRRPLHPVRRPLHPVRRPRVSLPRSFLPEARVVVAGVVALVALRYVRVPSIVRGGSRARRRRRRQPIASGPMPTEVRSVRYALDGAPLRADDHPAAQRAASRLGFGDGARFPPRGPSGRAGRTRIHPRRGARPRAEFRSGAARRRSRPRREGFDAGAAVGWGRGPARRAPRASARGGTRRAQARPEDEVSAWRVSTAPRARRRIPSRFPPPPRGGGVGGRVAPRARRPQRGFASARDGRRAPPRASAATAATAALLGASRGAGVSLGASGLGGGARDAVDAYCATDWYDALECAPRRRPP